ncbi:YadA-like family protein [Gallibacterium anatis]|uniref:YadA-like family protein n=1 Tax=Gallibacterium anatis TaxID=750 RepID=UPI003005E49A
MNKIYKVIFNRNKNRYEIVSELASSRGGKCKVKAGKQIAKLFMTGLLATFLSSVALAAEQEVVVKYDDATGTIKIVKKEDESQVLASYAVGGNISSIDPNEGTYPTGTISLGKDSKVLQNNTIAIGTDAHAGDASGSVTQSDGKIAIGNKTVASGDRSIALGNQSTTNKGSYNIVQGNDSIGIGTSTSVFGYSGVSIGRRNIIGVPDPDLVNNRVLTTKSKTPDKKGVDKEAAPGGNSVIVGAYNVAYGSRSSIIGTYSRAMGNNSVAIGSGVQSLTDGAIAIGKGSGYEFEDGSRKKGREKEFYGRDWELPPEYKVLKQVLSNDINGDKPYKKSSSGREGKYKYEKGGSLPKYNNYGAGSSDPGGFIVEGENALGIGTYTQVRGNSAIGLATGEMTADLSEKDKSQYARDMRKIMDMEEVLYEAQEALQAGTGDTAALESAVKAAEERLATAKKDFRETYLKKYSFVDGNGALGVGRQILAQGDRSMAVGDYAKAISSDAIAYGGQTLANGTNSMAMGGNAHVGTIDTSFDNSMAIGSHTNVQAGNAVALGAFSQVTGTNSLALGFGTQSSTDSNNITYNSVSGHDSTLIGSYGNIAGNNSILIGSSGSIANDRVVGLGNNINIEAADQNDQENNTAGSVFLGDHAGYVKDSKRSRSLGQVDVVGSAGKMELTESLSSTKGALRDYTKDFIYIYMLERQDDGTQIGAPIAVRSDFAGGDSTVGVVSVGSTYEQQFNSLKDIQDYHSKVGSLITVPVDVTVQVTKNGVPLGEQQQTRYFAADSTREEIYADSTLKEADKEKVWNTIQSKTSTPNTTYTVFETRRIQNVAPGLIGLNSTDAINGSQLFATNQMLGNLVGSLKKTFGDNVTITEDGQIKVSGGTLGWIAKAKAADGSNGTVNYQVGKDDKIAEDDLEKKGSAIEAADQLVFQAGKNIGLVQTPDTLTISTIDTPSFKSVELRGDEKTVDGKKVTEVTKIDSNGMKVVTETSTPASDGSTTPTVTEKVSTTVGKDGVSTDGSVKVTNGTTDLVTIDKGTDGSGTDKEYGKIGLDGKNGSNATITVDRGTSSLDNTKNIGTDPKQDISENNPAKMDRITYTTKDKNDKDVITHEVATMDDGLFFSGDSADGENNNVKNKFDRKLSQETKIIGGVNLGLTDSASAEERQKAIADKLTDGNIGVISDGTDTLTVKLAKNLMGLDSTTYTSPTTKTDDGDDATSTMKVDGNGVRFVDNNGDTVNNTPTFTTDGITGGNKQITNVGSGFKNGTTSVTIDDIKNPSDALKNSNVWNNAVNVGDLKNIIDTGFKLNTSGQPTKPDASTVKIGDTINIIDGANTKVSAIDDSTTGTHTFHIDVTGMPISYTDGEGNALTKIGDKYYKNTDIKNGKPKTDATEVPADKVTNNIKVINKDGTTNNQGTISNVKSVFDSNIGNGADTGSNVDEIKDGSVISNTGSNQFINDLTKLNDQVDPNATDAEAEKIRAKKDEEKLNSVSTVRDLQKVALTPLFFEGDVAQDAQTANTFGRKLSEKTKIVGGQKDVNQLTDNNIGVVSNGTDTLTIKLAKNLVNLTSVETGSGNNKTKMTENGITTTVKDGDTFKVTTTTPNGLATTEVKLDSEGMPKGESTTTMVTTDGVTITTQTPKNGDKPASTTETKLSKDGLATDGTIKVIGDNAKDLVTIAKETDPNATDKEFGTVAIDGKNGSKATLTVDRGTKSVTDKANILKDPKQPAGDNNPVSMDRLTYTTTGADGKSIINHEVATLDDGFFLTTSTDVAKGKAAGVKLNHTIKFTDGANTKVSTVDSKDGIHELHVDVTGLPMTYTVSQTGGTDAPVSVSKVGDTYQLADGTKLVKVGDKFYKPSQLVNPKADQPEVKPDEVAKDWSVNDSVSLVNKDGSTNAPTLKNVGSGLKDANGNSTTLDQAVGSNAVNVDDLRTLGKAATTEVTGTGAAEVTKVTGADGQNIYNVHVERFMQVAETDVEGNKVVKAADNHYYKEADIKDKTYIDGKWYNNTDIKDKTKIGDKWYSNTEITDGKANPDATELTVQATAPNKAVGLQNNLVNPNDNTPTRLSNLASALSGEVGNGANPADNSAINGIDKNGKPTSESGNNTFVKNVLDLDATEKTVEQLKTSLGHEPSEDEVKAEKARAEKDKALLNSAVTVADLQKTLQSPLFFEGDSADGVANENDSDKNTFARKLSQKTKIVGGVDLGLKENATAEERKKAIAEKLTDHNIGVISNGTDTLTIKLAKNLVNLTSVETGSGNNKTKMTENGITTTVKDGDTFKVTTTTPNGLATTEVKLDSDDKPTGESTTTTVTTDGVTITTQTPKNGGKPASTTETKLSKDGLATDGTIKVTGDNAKDLVTIAKETDPNATDKEFGTVAIDGKNGSKATLTVDRGTKSVTDSANVGKDPTNPIDKDNPVAGMDRLTYTTTGPNNETINHEVATLDDGFFLTTEHTEANKTRTVLFNNTIKVLDGANTKVSAMGGKDGTHTFSIDVTGLPVTYTATKTDANGTPTGEPVDVSKVGDGYQLADGTKLEKAGDKYYTPDQLENGQPKPDAEGLTIKQSVSLVQDNGAPATLERVGSGRRNGMNAKDTPMDWNSILNAAADNAEVNNMLTNAANIGDVRDAIKSITDGTSDNASGGFGLTGNNGDVKQDLGKTITVKGGIANKVDEAGQDLHVPEKSTTDKNTYVNVKNNEMVVEIAKDLIDLDSVTVGSATTGKGETTKITGKDVTIKDKAGNTNTSTATKDELTNANGDKTTVEAGKVDVSKKNADGTTSSTNIDGSKITLENKDKDSNTVGSKTDIGTDGIRITYKDDKGKTDPNKDVSLTDKGLNNGGNQIKNVGSGLVYKDGSKITDIAGITDQDILSNGVNVGDLQKAINSVTNSSNGGGFGLKGNNGKIMQDLGKTITVKGGIANKVDEAGQDLHVPEKSTTDQNTYVNVKDSEMVVEIAKDLTDLDSVTIGNVDKDGKGGTVINKDSMTVKDKDGKNSTNIGAGTIGTSKTDGNGNTSSTNINGSHMTLENKDKNGKLTGPKTEVSNKGITITPVDKDGKPIEGKKVKLSDKGLDNGGNQIKHVDSGLKKENGDSVKLEDAAGDMLNNAVNVGDLKSVNEKLKDDIINISNQVDDIKNSAPVVYTDANGKRVSKQGDKFVNEDGIEVKPHEIKLSLVNVDGKSTTNPSTLQNVAKGVNKTDAVNVEQLKEATEKPLTFNGDAGSSSAKLGETVAIKGGANSADLTDNNIGVIANSSTKTLNVKLSKKLKGLESAEFVDNNGNTTNITGDGVHISGGNGSNVSLTSQGLNNGGNRITNVAPGVEATDAVNVSQLNQVGAALHNRINNVAKGAYGGVASAGAMASLPQAYLPGKSMVAAGASHYRGESAVALGASRISDNGKIILKLNASHNTSGNTMVGAGVGYQF